MNLPFLLTCFFVLLFAEPGFAARDILVFFDVSGSTKRETVNEYFQEYRKIVKATKEGDAVACALINGNTKGNFSPVGALKLRAKGGLESPTGYREEMERAKNRGMLEVKRKLDATKPGGDTDILSSLSLARDYFTTSGNGGEKVLVLFSDMVEETKTLNIKGLTKGQVDRAFGRVGGSIPSLAGVTIYAAGAVGEGPEGYQALEAFWKRIFQASGGNCVLFARTLYSFK